MGRKWVLISTVALALIVAGGAVALWRLTSKPSRPARAAAVPPPAPPLTGIITLAGKIQPQHVVTVGADVDGNVDAFFADAGQEVEEGQLLARIVNQGLETGREVAGTAVDNAQARVSKLEAALLGARLESSRADAEASRARSELERAEKAFQRQKMLFGEGATPRLVLEKTTREHEAAQADYAAANQLAQQARERIAAALEQVEAARKILADKTKTLEDAQASLLSGEVHSPVAGVVLARKGELGKPLGDQRADVFQIAVDLSLLQVMLEPEPPVLARAKAGMEALVIVPELQTDGIAARVKGVQGTLLLVDFTSPNPNIKPGMQAEVRLKLE